MQNNPRYANNSNYKNDTMIRKEAYSHQVNFFEWDFELVDLEPALMAQFWRIIDDDADDDEDGDDDDDDDDDFELAMVDKLAQKKINYEDDSDDDVNDDVEQAVMDELRLIIDDDDDDFEDGDDGDEYDDDVEQAVMDELRRIIEDSEIMAEDDELWPQPDRVGVDITNDKI